MIRSSLAVAFSTFFRVLSIFLLIGLYLKGEMIGTLSGVLFASILALFWPMGRATDPIWHSAVERIYSLTCFFVLILFNACPPFFLGLLITVSLVQATVSTYLYWHGQPFQESLLPRALPLQKVQWVWISLMAGFSLLELHYAEAAKFFLPLEALGYLVLASFHAYVFYLYSLQIQPHLWPSVARHYEEPQATK